MKNILVALMMLMLAGCASDDHNDLRQWMNESSKNVKGKIAPLPQVKPYEPVAYDVGNLVDPFRPGKIGVEQKKGGGLRPDMDRPREPLESYPLESLKYVGFITKNKKSFAVIQVDGALYQVRTGNYIGQNFGVITHISESDLTLKELVQDAVGDWTERESSLQLQGQEGGK